MSRVGNDPITLPAGVEVTVSDGEVAVKGPKGELTERIDSRITTSVDDGVVTLARTDEERQTRALHGLSRALVNNMVVGVSEGYEKQLETVGVGYRAALKGRVLELQVGFSHPVTIEAPEGIEFEVPENTKIIVRGIDKVKVTATQTGKVPNTSPTAASSGSDMNAMAALDAVNRIKGRLLEFIAEKNGVSKVTHSTWRPCSRKITPARMEPWPPTPAMVSS